MAISRGRLIGIRVALGVYVVLAVIGVISDLFLGEASFKGWAPAGETFTKPVDAMFKLEAGYLLGWAVAAVLAFRNVLGNLGLLKAIIIALGIIVVAGAYANFAVLGRASPTTVILFVLLAVIFVALLVLYPRGQRAS
ncbi:MAG: hypothetical protein HY686_05970 [Chloroflexi bacterium]|nr:hypothetical protein [Chloroflexota bacterium]